MPCSAVFLGGENKEETLTGGENWEDTDSGRTRYEGRLPGWSPRVLETSEVLESGDGAGEPKASWAGEELREL